PRDYINSLQLVTSLGLVVVGLAVAAVLGGVSPTPDAARLPLEIVAPAINLHPLHAPPILPFLFVTIACGAISGFHSLVSSGTTSKQLSRLRDARLIGYGSMLGEGSLALAAVLAAVAGIALVGQCTIPGQGLVEKLEWRVYYDTWQNANKNTSQAFVLGGAEFLKSLGVSGSFGVTMMAVLVVSFAATTLDTAARIQRFVVTELAASIGLRVLTNRYLATVVAMVPAVLLAFGKATDASGRTTQAAWLLWPIFGASNQMMAALTLLVMVLYFWQLRRPILPLLIPMLVVMAISIAALVLKMRDFLAEGNWLLVGFSGVLLGMIVWMIVEGATKLLALRGSDPVPSESAPRDDNP
ncbi:MAG: carbon starvation protein A, partial [Planctomycetes bacterium]|nr:carbon starvation protein A [Planctomycetota bacterium]